MYKNNGQTIHNNESIHHLDHSAIWKFLGTFLKTYLIISVGDLSVWKYWSFVNNNGIIAIIIKAIATLKNISNHQIYVTIHQTKGEIRVVIINNILIFANELHSVHFLFNIFFEIKICSALHIVDFGTTLQNNKNIINNKSALNSQVKNLIQYENIIIPGRWMSIECFIHSFSIIFQENGIADKNNISLIKKNSIIWNTLYQTSAYKKIGINKEIRANAIFLNTL